MNENNQQKIEELQIIENNLREFLMQRQTLQVEINEIENALDELSATEGEVYKIVAGIMVKIERDTAKEELDEKKIAVESKISAIERQEKIIEKKSEELKKEILDGKRTANHKI